MAVIKSKKISVATGRGPEPVDIHVGARLRLRRNLIGMSQEELGKATRLTFQQIQKYERGMNRMGASRLHQISKILNVPVAWFFEELPEEMTTLARRGHNENKQLVDGTLSTQSEILQRRETADLLRAWYKINDPKKRRKIMDVIKWITEEE